MGLQQNAISEDRRAASPIAPGEARWNWLPFARLAWIGLALVLLAYFLVSIPLYYQTSLIVCTSTDLGQCRNALVNEGNAQALAQLHVAIADYVGLIVAIDIVGSLLSGVIGVLIFWRTGRDGPGMVLSLFPIVVGATQLAMPLAAIPVTSASPSLLLHLVEVSGVLNVVQAAAVATFVVTFPTGQLTPRWSVVLIALAVLPPLLPTPLWEAASTPLSIAFALTYLSILGVQVYRYARTYTLAQRQQAKWFIFAFSIATGVIFLPHLASLVAPSLSAPDSAYQLLLNPLSAVTSLLFPLSVGIAILRYRLWDIDVLINRALVYGSLTVLLAALYVGLIFALQALMRLVTGTLTQQPLVLVASTLAIAALVQPLRHRLQTTIDVRFYRRKYDAAQVVAAFSSTLRQEVDLDQLRAQLLTVVEDTMQPTHVALWLRPASLARKPNTPM